jgi:heat shock protein HslJ
MNRTQMLRVMGLAVATAAVAMGCGGGLTEPSDAVGRTWRLVTVEKQGSDPVSVSDPSKYTLRLEDNGNVGVMSDCNSCGGTYSLNGSTLELSVLTCTLVACGETSLDSVYRATLEGNKTVAVADSELTIVGGDTTLRFRR